MSCLSPRVTGTSICHSEKSPRTLVAGRPYVPWQFFQGFLGKTADMDVTWDPVGRVLLARPAQHTIVGVQLSVANIQGIASLPPHVSSVNWGQYPRKFWPGPTRPWYPLSRCESGHLARRRSIAGSSSTSRTLVRSVAMRREASCAGSALGGAIAKYLPRWWKRTSQKP